MQLRCTATSSLWGCKIRKSIHDQLHCSAAISHNTPFSFEMTGKRDNFFIDQPLFKKQLERKPK